MSKSEKQIVKESERNRKILETAFRIFVERKIEPVSMGEIVEAAEIGRASLFRYYPNKLELVIAVCTKEWKEYMDELDRTRPISSIDEIPAIDRLILVMDSCIDMYQKHKDLLQYNDNFNYYVSHMGVTRDNEHLTEFYNALYSINTRLHMMYEKAKADHSFRTDIPTAVKKAAKVGSTLSMRRSRRMEESSKNVSDKLASTVSKLPERVPTTSMRA